MSPKGMQPASVAGSQEVLNPAVLYPCAFKDCRTSGYTVVTQLPPPAAMRASAIDAFKPPGRKKLVSAADTQGLWLVGLMPQGAAPLPTAKGPKAEFEAGSPCAASKLATSRSPRCVLALIGRLRCRPPLKL